MKTTTRLKLFAVKTLMPWIGATLLLCAGLGALGYLAFWVVPILFVVTAVPAYLSQKLAEVTYQSDQKDLVNAWIAGASSKEDKAARLDLFNAMGFDVLGRDEVHQELSSMGHTDVLFNSPMEHDFQNPTTNSTVFESFGDTRPTGFQDAATFMDVNSTNSLSTNVYETGPAHSSLD